MRIVVRALGALFPSCSCFPRPRSRRTSTTWATSGCRAPTAPAGSTVVRQRLLADPAPRAVHDPEPRRHRVPPALAGAGRRPYDAPNTGTIDFRQSDAGLVNLDLPEQPAAAAVPRAVRRARRVRQQRRRHDVHADLGHALADARGAAAARHALELARRRRQRRRQREPLHRSRARRRARVPAGRHGGQGRVRRHPGGRAGRPVRQRRADRLVGARRRSGEDRVPPRRRRDERVRSPRPA